ncbi:hypothetical protein ACFLZE_05120 [Thermodesulfobacteriota bacterium]
MTPETAQNIIVISSIVSASSTLALAGIGLWKLSQLTSHLKIQGEREKKWKTVAACDLYLTDPILFNNSKRIWERSNSGTDYTSCRRDDQDTIQLLNYFESLSVGIEQRIYVEEIVKDNLEHSIQKAVKVFIKGESGTIHGKSWIVKEKKFAKEYFPFLVKLYDRWFKEDPKPHFENSEKLP